MNAYEISTGRSNKSDSFLLGFHRYITCNLPTRDQLVSDLQQLKVAEFQMALKSCFWTALILFVTTWHETSEQAPMTDDIAKHRKSLLIQYDVVSAHRVWSHLSSIPSIATGISTPQSTFSTPKSIHTAFMTLASQDKMPLHYTLSHLISWTLTFHNNYFRKKKGFESLSWGLLCVDNTLCMIYLADQQSKCSQWGTRLLQNIFLYRLGRMVKFYIRLRMGCKVSPIILQNNSKNNSKLKTWVILPKNTVKSKLSTGV